MNYEHDFRKALFDAEGHQLAGLTSQPAFAVYRNTVMKGCIDALEANYPAVARLVGRDWFRAAAAVYVASEPPTDPRLVAYGESLARFLSRFEPAAGLPYLPAVATLDWLWSRSHVSADAGALEVATLGRYTPAALAEIRLRPHPAARWFWCDDHPACTLWSCNRAEGSATPEGLHWAGEGTLITRPDEAVQWTGIGRAGCAFLDGCAHGLTLAEASEAATAVDPQADMLSLLALIIGQGALETTR